MSKAIIITGTPGTGKTTLSKLISNKFNLKIIDAKEFAISHNLVISKDKDNTLVIDEQKWAREMQKFMDSNNNKHSNLPVFIVDGLFSHFLSPKYTLLCIVTNLPLPELKERLVSRGYSDNKIRDNLEAEAFNECYLEAIEQGHDVISINTTNKQELDALLSKIGRLLAEFK